jgi:hypothetical protein
MALYPTERAGEERYENVSRNGPFHAAVATPLSIEEVEAVGRKYGCHTSLCNRGPWFRVIEFWVDNCLMLEMLTPEMQEEYQRSITIENWRGMLSSFGLTPEGEAIEDAA